MVVSASFVVAGVATRAPWRAVFSSWRAPTPFSLRGPSGPRFHSAFGRAPNASSKFGHGSGNGSVKPPGKGGLDTPSSELYAASPELDAMLMKASDAPALAHIVSYNVLSSSLASPSHFQNCDPADLDSHTRLSRVLDKLKEPIASRAIICLQEVSLAWAGNLHAFFASREFHFVLASYGSYFNGYMGVALAFPINTYEVLDLKLERLTDCHKWPVAQPPTGIVKALVDLRTRIAGVLNALFGDLSQTRKRRRRAYGSDVWQDSKDRRNMLVFARLRCRANGARICVGTYHMPCAFYSPSVMLIHSALVVSRFQECCRNDPGVLAGDFNIKPRDSAYNMITSGDISAKHPDYPAKGPDGSQATKWMPMLQYPMKSAYKEVLGQEPDFTNYAQVKQDPAFIDTLDYIFCREDVDVVDVLRLPHRDHVKGPYPVRSEPSDHVMIGATLRLQAATSARSQISTWSSKSRLAPR